MKQADDNTPNKKIEVDYQALIENTDDVVFCVDEAGYYRFVNRVFASAFGKTPEYFDGKSYWDIYSKEHADFRFAATSKVFETGEALSVEVTVPLAEETRFYLAKINPIKDAQGNVKMALVHSTDITTLKASEREEYHSAEIQRVLREISEAALQVSSAEKFYQTLHQLLARILPAKNLYISILDESSGQIYRPYCADETGLVPARRPLGKGLTEYFMRTGHAVHVTNALFKKLREAGEIELLFAPVAECIGAPLKDAQGKSFGAITLYLPEKRQGQTFNAKDVDALNIVATQVSMAIERHRKDEELKEHERRLKDIIDFLPDAALAIDSEKRVIVWNKAIERMTGIPAQDMLGKGDYEYTIPFYGERRPQLMDLIWEESCRVRENYMGLGQDGDALTAETFCGALYNGRGAYIFVKATPLYDRNGKIVGAIELIRDVTDRVLAEQAQQRSYDIQAVLKEIADAVVQAASMDELYRCVHGLLGRVLPTDRFHINLIDEETNEIVVPYKADDVSFIPERRPVGFGMTEYIIKLGRAVHITPEDQQRLAETGEYRLAQVQNVKPRHYLGAPLIDSQGNPFGVMALITPGTLQPFRPEDVEVMAIVAAQVSMAIERKRKEEKLKESELRYRAMMQQSSDAVCLVDPVTKKFIEVNARWVRMLGYSAEEAQNITVYDVIAESHESVDRSYQEISRQKSNTILRRLRKKDGRIVEVERLATPIEFGGKQVMMISQRDLSAERKLQDLILKDVALAADVQKTLLPQGFDDVLVSVRTIYVPYHMVSGDFYDYAWSPDHRRLTGFILDISGHGVSSSLQGIAVSTYFRDVLDSPMRLDARLNWINQRVMRYFTDETYAAAIYFEMDFNRRTMSFATAGIYGFLASSPVLPAKVVKAGSLVGIATKADYTEWTVPIHDGDAFYFMSDGIFDQVSELKNLRTEDFEQTVARLRLVASDPSGIDDCCAVCVRVNGAPTFPHRFEFHRYGEYSRIRQRLKDLIYAFCGEESGRIFIVLGEAVNNAARESMDVHVKVNRIGRRLVIRVKDGGAGFDGNARLAAFYATEKEDAFEGRLYADGGRGILIMVSWMDKVLYNRKGNEVMMVKRLAD